ncbi:hypothetical protein Nm8I071_22830 [Nonomuraea sp. TT08I-71]|nr:hypothetical protein Nm8I071_22830 [Nonomuraea sp. TT08I-71]
MTRLAGRSVAIPGGCPPPHLAAVERHVCGDDHRAVAQHEQTLMTGGVPGQLNDPHRPIRRQAQGGRPVIERFPDRVDLSCSPGWQPVLSARIVTREGLNKLAARAVAEEVGVERRTVYRHVTDLTHLVALAGAQVGSDVVADLRQAAPPQVPPRSATHAVARAVVGRARAAPSLVELLVP